MSQFSVEQGNVISSNCTYLQPCITQVRVLATLDHPYIIGYYDSFEKDGVLMIGQYSLHIYEFN